MKRRIPALFSLLVIAGCAPTVVYRELPPQELARILQHRHLQIGRVCKVCEFQYAQEVLFPRLAASAAPTVAGQ